jgi:hypothetical protein
MITWSRFGFQFNKTLFYDLDSNSIATTFWSSNISKPNVELDLNLLNTKKLPNIGWYVGFSNQIGTMKSTMFKNVCVCKNAICIIWELNEGGSEIQKMCRLIHF